MNFFKPLKEVATAIASASVLAAIIAGSALAGQYVGGDLNLNLNENDDVYILAADLTANGRVGGDVNIAGANIEINLTIEGDLGIAGQDIEIDGSVLEDVELIGEDIRIGSTIGQDLDAAGVDITVSGSVAGETTLAGVSVFVTPEAVLSGQVEIAARSLYIEGRIGLGADIQGREVVIDGHISGPLVIRANEVTFGEGAEVSGPITIRATKPPQIEEGAQIADIDYEYASFDYDTVNRDGIDVDIGLDNFDFAPSPWAFGGVFAASAFVLGLLTALAAPRGVSSIALAFRKRPWVSGLLGLVVLAVSPILLFTLFLLLLVTIIGIPLAFLLIFAYPIVMFLAFAFGGIVIGDLALNRTGGPAGFGLRAGSFLIALLMIALLSAVPVLGFIILPVVFCIGLGAWTLAIFARQSPQAQMGTGEI